MTSCASATRPWFDRPVGQVHSRPRRLPQGTRSHHRAAVAGAGPTITPTKAGDALSPALNASLHPLTTHRLHELETVAERIIHKNAPVSRHGIIFLIDIITRAQAILERRQVRHQ